MRSNTPAQPVEGPGLFNTFVCNCSDCHKFHASMFASNFTIDDKYLKHERGQDNLTRFAQKKTIASGNEMANYFCKTCGTLLYRVSEGYPGYSILRIGTVDDFTLMETKLRPQIQQFNKDRTSWVSTIEGAKQADEMGF